jgi:hypothetical protein
LYIVIVDVGGIQSYVFSSNRMRENLGASQMIWEATERWPAEVLQNLEFRSNLKEDGSLDASLRIEDGGLDAEIVYTGGGNALILFSGDDNTTACQFTRELSRLALLRAPGMKITIVHQHFDWDESLAEAINNAFEHTLFNAKAAKKYSTPLLGLGVTACCQSTGLPAVGLTQRLGDDPQRLASAETLGKWAAVSDAKKRLNQEVAGLLTEKYIFPDEFDDLGRTEEEFSYIGVVHADGNNTTKRKQEIGKNFKDNNRAYIEAMRGFSENLKTAARYALIATLKQLIESINDGEIVQKVDGEEIAKIVLKKDKDYLFLPFRPIVFGGDDFSFVCDGRIALSLTVRYLGEFEKAAVNLPGEDKATASAGVAMVKSHHPFAMTYKLAEELCGNAKGYRKEKGLDNCSCLDWHITQGSLLYDINKIRERHYQVPSGTLYLRPVTLYDNQDDEVRSWSVISKLIDKFQNNEWMSKRNKMKALWEALRDGEEAVVFFCNKYLGGEELPTVSPSQPDFASKGFSGRKCGYFDVLELVDHFIPLGERGREKHATQTEDNTEE